MKCPKCDANVSENQKFCMKCGEKIEIKDDFSQQKNASSDSNTEEALDQESSQIISFEDFDHSQEVHTVKNESAALPPIPKNQQKKSIFPKLIAVLLTLLIVGVIGFMGYNLFFNEKPNLLSKSSIETPSYSLNEGTYASEQTVVINKPKGNNLTLYYTTDGSDPDTNDLKYDENLPLQIEQDTTLRCIAIDQNGNKSPIAVATYKIQNAKAQTSPSTTALSESLQDNLYGKWKNGSNTFYFKKDGTYQYSDGRDAALGNYAVYQVSPTKGNFTTNTDAGSSITLNASFDLDCSQRKDGIILIRGNVFTYIDDIPVF